MVRNVIFDLDGTLLDSHAQIVGIVDAMLAARGVAGRVDRAGSRRHMSQGGEHLIATLLGEHCGDPAAELADFRRRYAAEPTSPSALYAEVHAGLAALRRAGTTLALCSNKPQHLCEAVLRDTGLADLFAVVVGGRPDIPAKPAPDMLALVLAELGATADECVFVGDSEVDHATAAALGMPFLFVTYGYAAPDWTPPGARTFDRFADLIAVFEALPHHA